MIFLFGLLIWTAGIFLPLLKDINPLYLVMADQFYSTVCHQDELKSFICNEQGLLVCARCTGIYSGALAFSLISVIFRGLSIKQNKKLFLIFSLPMMIDVISVLTGIYEYNHIVAFLTGFIFGSSVFLFILATVENSISEHFTG